jgi:hypothetical protein
MDRIGVLTDRALITYGERGVEELLTNIAQMENPLRLEFLLTMAHFFLLRQLWIHHSYTGVHGKLRADCGEWDVWPRDIRDTDSDTWDREHWLHGFYPGEHGAGIEVVLPFLDNMAPWHKAATGVELLQEICVYNAAMRTPYMRSPGLTGTRLMTAVHGSKSALFPVEPPPPALRQTHIYHSPAEDFAWIRALTPEEQEYQYLHAYDKNAMYLGASGSARLGTGDWTHLDPADLWGTDIGAYPGYYRIDREALSYHDYDLPSPLDPSGYYASRQPEQIWVTAPALEVALQCGVPVDISEAYVWQKSSRYLEPWQAQLVEARRTLRARDYTPNIALQVFKDTYAQSIAWLDGHWLAGTSGNRLYRPDWRHAVIAQAAANLYRNAVRAVQRGAHIVSIATDCLYVVSNCPDPWKCATEECGFTLSPEVGRYKVAVNAFPLQRVRRVFTNAGFARTRSVITSLTKEIAAYQEEARVTHGNPH